MRGRQMVVAYSMACPRGSKQLAYGGSMGLQRGAEIPAPLPKLVTRRRSRTLLLRLCHIRLP